METRKQLICNALRAFIRQRPGLEFGNYGNVKSYRAELRGITRDLGHAQTLLRAVEGNDAITADDILKAADGGRLEIVEPSTRTAELRALISKTGDDYLQKNMRSEIAALASRGVRVSWCAGQYWPTEYRRGVAAVLASVLWAHVREHAMPARSNPGDRDALYVRHGGTSVCSAGDWLRAHFRREFGRALADRFFN